MQLSIRVNTMSDDSKEYDVRLESDQTTTPRPIFIPARNEIAAHEMMHSIANAIVAHSFELVNIH